MAFGCLLYLLQSWFWLRLCRAKIFAFATHGLFNGPAPERIEQSALDEVVITNTVPLKAGIPEKTNKIKQLSIGKLLSESIQCIHTVRLPTPSCCLGVPCIHYGEPGTAARRRSSGRRQPVWRKDSPAAGLFCHVYRIVL